MSARTNIIADRLPRIYRSWEKDSNISLLIQSISAELDKAEIGIEELLKAHWVDTAQGIDLDRLAATIGSKRLKKEDDEHFRIHLKKAVDEFRGGGTIPAILKELEDYATSDEVKIIENPPIDSFAEFSVIANDTWTLGSNSIADEQLSLVLTVEGEGEISKPKIMNLDTGNSVIFEGDLKTGQQLVVNSKGSSLDGKDVTKNVTFEEFPTLLRKGSIWKYSESLLEGMGVFDKGKFDEHTFALGVPTVSVRFNWTRRQPATIMIQIKPEALSRSRVTTTFLESMANYLKAAGIKAIIKVMEELE